ncbi:MAG TPA: IS256 family transposase, partial [Vicinamibacteria bacterium]|nr:IS256 family transposase [Vicinamibacteria bacterium]
TQEALAQLRLPLAELMRTTLLDTVITTGTVEAIRMLEQQRVALCGPKHAQDEGRQAYRHGHCPGSLVMGGRRVTLPRPRVRSLDGRELELPAWKQWSNEDPLEERALAQMLLGVSTRGYASSLEPLPAPLPERGKSRSAVSRRFVRRTQKRLADLLRRDLSDVKLTVLMIDGIHFEEHVVLAALGIDESGQKHVLGLWEGATENARACKGLLEDLLSRGLVTDRALLVVIDGAKALYKAVKDVFGKRALIQRCQEHKKRNVADQLPESLRPSVRRAMNEAYESSDPQRALRLLENLAARLEGEHPGAAASLREGLAETLTVIELGLTGWLRLTLRTTNPIDNLFGSVRKVSHRVKRWRGGRMMLRWCAASVLDASTRFRRIKGHREMPKLIAALKAHEGTLDQQEAVA